MRALGGARACFWLAAALAAPALALGARIGDLGEVDFLEQLGRLFSLRDPAVRAALTGAVFLGICSGLLGSFIVVRRLSLMGDALSHAVLPGVAVGFLLAGTKDPLAIFAGAVAAGSLGAVVTHLVTRTTHIKEDSSLGMTLAGFYGLGIVLLTMIQGLSVGNKAGIDKFLFGQAAALTDGEVWLMGGVALLSVALVTLFYKQFLVGSFDPEFSRSLGLPTQFFHYLLMLLLAFAVVVSLQAVGAVLVAAMLITPAAAAYMLADRMGRMLVLACAFGVLSGVLGVVFSFMGNNLSTGPLMVLAASSVFALCFLFSPRHGMVARWWRFRSRVRRTRLENLLKAVYQAREARGFAGEAAATVSELAERLGEPEADAQRRLGELVRAGLGEVKPIGGEPAVYLNPEGWLRACSVVRNHRLWELYLTNQAAYEPDHVHEDAEVIEHVLGEDTVRQLERLLDFPQTDPHGKLIPSLTDLQRSLVERPTKPEETGYRMPVR